MNNEAFKVVVAQPMGETTSRPLSTLTEASVSVVGAVIAHVMDAYTVDMPPPPPLPIFHPLTLFLPVPPTPLPLPPIMSPHTLLPQRG